MLAALQRRLQVHLLLRGRLSRGGWGTTLTWTRPLFPLVRLPRGGTTLGAGCGHLPLPPHCHLILTFAATELLQVLRLAFFLRRRHLPRTPSLLIPLLLHLVHRPLSAVL